LSIDAIKELQPFQKKNHLVSVIGTYICYSMSKPVRLMVFSLINRFMRIVIILIQSGEVYFPCTYMLVEEKYVLVCDVYVCLTVSNHYFFCQVIVLFMCPLLISYISSLPIPVGLRYGGTNSNKGMAVRRAI
jgi:hypothetical protein